MRFSRGSPTRLGLEQPLKPRIIPQAVPLRLDPEHAGCRPTNLPNEHLQRRQRLITPVDLRVNRRQIRRDQRSVEGVR